MVSADPRQKLQNVLPKCNLSPFHLCYPIPITLLYLGALCVLAVQMFSLLSLGYALKVMLFNHRMLPCPVTTGYQQSEPANVADVGWG